MKHYEINGSTPPDPKAKYPHRANIVCHVIADDAPTAMRLAIEKHPGLEVWSLSHRGRVDIIEQKPVPA